MNDYLYFIPLISDAISQPNPKVKIKKAFEKIMQMGQRRKYEQGYLQFLQFMKEAIEFSGKEIPWLTKIWREHEEEPLLKLFVTTNGETIASFPISPSEVSQKMHGAMPGFYTFQLNTGRILWMGELLQKDLFWLEVYPDSELEIAADTADLKPEPTQEIKILNGEFIIYVFPGFEGGIIEVKRSK
jgi:hypothetical protein